MALKDAPSAFDLFGAFHATLAGGPSCLPASSGKRGEREREVGALQRGGKTSGEGGSWQGFRRRRVTCVEGRPCVVRWRSRLPRPR